MSNPKLHKTTNTLQDSYCDIFHAQINDTIFTVLFEINKLVTIYNDFFALEGEVTCNKREDNYVTKLQVD